MNRRIAFLFFIILLVFFSCTQKEQEIEQEIHQEIQVESVSISQSTAALKIGETLQLTASAFPETATNKVISWSSSNQAVASVSASGLVTAVEIGTVTITASVVTGIKAECTVNVGMKYGEVAITNLKPIEIMPVIGRVTSGDTKVYDHIEHLRIAEATRIREMMSKYGAGEHSNEEYQQLMGRLVVGMSMECPSFPKTFEVVGRGFTDLATWGNGHSDIEWGFLDMIVPNTRRIVEINAFYGAEHTFKTEKPEQIDWINMESFIDGNPNSIVILACSSESEHYDRYHENPENGTTKRQFCRSGRLMYFKAGGNVGTHDGVWISKCFHKDIETDGHGLYSSQSMANGKNDAKADMALFVSIGTGPTGDIDQTGYIYESSLFPIGFHDDVLFAGRTLPVYHKDRGTYGAYSGHYATSFANYYNAAIMSLCFQMYAEAKDVFELLDMVRSTCLTDYIRLDGQTQPLQLINPAGLYKKYLTPQNLPTVISNSETLSFDKGYYKGVLFSIPGAEVKINNAWIAFDNKNKDAIFSQNPMNLEWRLNGELLKKYGYNPGQTVKGQIITVDDKWGGLRLEVPMTITVK